MVIMFYISTLIGGGAARVMVNLANQFEADGNRVIIVTNLKDQSAYPINEMVRVIHIDNNNDSHNRFIKRNISRVIKLRKLVKDIKPSCIISFLTENNIRCLIATLFLNVHTYTSIRSDPDHECGKGLRGAVIRKAYELSDGVICQTDEALQWFTLKTQRKGTVILNQIDESFYIEKEKAERKNTIITAGRFVKAKNHQLLINAFSDISDEIEDVLIIYGDGELKDSYYNLVKELHLENRVFFPGVATDMIKCYDNAKLFVLSSDYEGLPNVLMEAMVREVPCISTDCPCGGPKMLLDDGNYGILVEVNNRYEMAKAMLNMSNNTTLRDHFSQKLKTRKMDFKTDKVFLQWKNYITKNSNKR